MRGKHFTNGAVSWASYPSSTFNSSLSYYFLMSTSVAEMQHFLKNSMHPGPKRKVAGIHFLFGCTVLHFLLNFSPSFVAFIQFCLLATFSRKTNLASDVSFQRHSVRSPCPHSVFPDERLSVLNFRTHPGNTYVPSVSFYLRFPRIMAYSSHCLPLLSPHLPMS